MTQARWVDARSDALSILKNLCSRLGIPRERIFVVPGNHDYEWYSPDLHGAIARRALANKKADDSAVTFDHVIHFQKFVEELCGAGAARTGSVCPLELPHYTLKLGLLDSCRITPTLFHEYGYLSNAQIKEVMRGFQTAPAKREVRAIILHHHVNSIIPTEAPAMELDVSVTLDAARLIDRALATGISFILHGHQHYPCISKINKTHPDKAAVQQLAKNDIYVISAGSVGVKRDRRAEEAPNTYSLLSFGPESADVNVRKISSAGSDGGPYLNATIPLQVIQG